jgi:hypothetical protein
MVQYFAMITLVAIFIAASFAETPLNQYPMIISHDAVSGEIVSDRDHVLSDWTKTQSTGLTSQLDCGARAFDYRPQIKGDMIYGHHGGVTVYKPMEESVQEILKWTAANPIDLIILYISHPDGDNCYEQVSHLLSKYGVYQLSDCSKINSLTYEGALKLAGSNRLFAIFDCTEENFDENINCYGKDFVCYDDPSWGPTNTSSVPFSHLSTHLQAITAKDPTTDYKNMLWMAQAHWQSSAETITLGTLHRSSLVLDESRSEINLWVQKQVEAGAFSHLNFLELDQVCDNGPAIYTALKKKQTMMLKK